MKQGLAAQFVPETTQVSAALSYPGTIKAFHFHKHQTDLWVPRMGMFQVALVDLRDRLAHLRSEEHAVCRRAEALADSDSARRGTRLQSDRRGGGHAGVRHQPAVRSARTKAASRITTPSIAYDWELQHKMKFLVTGGAGFIGSAFVRLLLRRCSECITRSSIWISSPTRAIWKI